MRLPLTWLHEYTTPDLSVRDLATRLAMTGTEVDRVHLHGVPDVANFVVGHVLSAEQHPDADRLKVCMVDVGDGEPQQIVCGAPNVAAGQTVGVARPGAVMPDGTKLKKAKLRGVVSHGMILAEDEVQAGAGHAGTMVLANGIEPGTPLADVLAIRDDVLELEITPNRPDCLGVYGVAREVHAVTGAPLAPPPWEADPGAADLGAAPAGITVTVADPDLCPRFTGRVFEDVTIGPSPLWLKARLMAAGQRPISNVVDITNYVMLLTGHPLHAFDLDRVAGGRLNVRWATEGEQVTTLDGQTRTLDPRMGVIEDADGPTSIAGVMGGERSEVHDATTRVLMEVATWNGPCINYASWKLGLRSEASARFEKGLPPEGCMEAQAVATALMIELTGARLVPGTLDVGSPGEPEPIVPLRDARVAGLLGAEVPRERSAEILTALGFSVSAVDGRAQRRRPALAARRRHPRGGPHRGGRPHRRARAAARDDPGEPHRAARAADPRPAPAPPRRGRARRAGAAGGRRLVVHRPRPPGPAARAGGRPPARPRRAGQPDVGRAVRAAADGHRIAARHRAAQPRARPGGSRDLRVGHRLPARRGAARRRAPRARGAPRRPARARRAGATAARPRRTSTRPARSSRRSSAR